MPFRKKALKPQRVKLICGFIFKQPNSYEKAKTLLEKLFGETDFESQALPFNYTDYYEKEFGKSLTRKFVSFSKLIPPESLFKIKTATNILEEKLSANSGRLVNIDPGYLDLAKLVLATTKDYNHRIYLSNGIFAEITLHYRNISFKPWEWTYPDYKSDAYIKIFNKIREIYGRQIRKVTAGSR